MDLAEIKLARVRHETIRSLVAFLARGSSSAQRVGKRVLLLDFMLRAGEEDREKQKVLARRLGISEARVSARISDLARSLESLRTVSSPAESRGDATLPHDE